MRYLGSFDEFVRISIANKNDNMYNVLIGENI